MSSSSWQIVKELLQKMGEVTELLILLCEKIYFWLKLQSERPVALDVLVTFSIVFAFYALCIANSEIAFRYSDGGKYKWIKREWKLLRALIQDYEEISESASQIAKKSRQYLDSDLIQDGICVQVLNDKENGWINKAKKVVQRATPFIQNFESLRQRRKSIKWRYVFFFFEYIETLDAAYGMQGFKNKIKDNLGMNGNGNPGTTTVCASDVNGSLEQSRSKIRSLLDRSSVDEIKSVESTVNVCLSADELISSLKSLMTSNLEPLQGLEGQMKSFRLQLQLLNAFMKDIQQLKVLESKMERSWVVEANETIEEANDVIKMSTRATQKQDKLLSKLSVLSNWMVRRKLKKDMRLVCTRISGLLETKERYGVKFIRRDLLKSFLSRTESSNHSHLHPSAALPEQQNFNHPKLPTDDMKPSPSVLVDLILNWLNQLPHTSRVLVDHVNSLRNELEGVLQHFNDVQATEGCAINLRNACLEQLNNLATEAHMEDSALWPSKHLPEIIISTEHAVRCMRVYSIEKREDSCSVVGFEEDIDRLVWHLIHEGNDHPSIICIEGMKGVGKTTLAKKVFYQKTIEDHFKVQRWISMPTYSSEKLLLGMVGKQVLQEKELKWDMAKDYWINRMRNLLKEETSLLVFDNVPSKEAWDLIIPAFSDISNGSKVVLITSNKAIALHPGKVSFRYPIRLRTIEESWDLFTQMVQYSPDDEKVILKAKKLVESVGGLPLAIIRIGYQLWGKKLTPENLSKVIESITKEQNQLPWFDNVAVNVVDLQLDPILSKCFSYFQHFPRDFEVPVRRITASWIAQGLGKSPPSNQIQISTDGEGTLESFAYENLMQLVSCNMIQPLQIKPNGRVRTCRLPSAVHDLLLQSPSSPTTSLDWQHIFPFDGNDASLQQPNAMQNDQGLDCVVFFDARTEIKPGEGVAEILYKGITCGLFLQLLVLDLEGVLRPQLPSEMGRLKQLEYLGLRWTYILTLPLSIFDLVKLKTLDLKHTHVMSLPSSVWNLKELRHLYLNQNCRLLQPTAISKRKLQMVLGVIVQTPSSMRDLQILSGLFVDKANVMLVRRLKFPRLRKLRLAFQLTKQEQTLLQKWIATLSNLVSLKLRSINEKRQPQDLNLEHISELKNLSSLHVFGKLVDPSIIEKLPQSLTHLTLSASGIVEDPMPTLGKLPNLKSLCLFSGSYTGKDLVCSMNGFPLLLVLKLWNLASLENLKVVAGALQNLRKLDSRSCRKFIIPPELKHLITSHEAEKQPAAAAEEQSAEAQ